MVPSQPHLQDHPACHPPGALAQRVQHLAHAGVREPIVNALRPALCPDPRVPLQVGQMA